MRLCSKCKSRVDFFSNSRHDTAKREQLLEMEKLLGEQDLVEKLLGEQDSSGYVSSYWRMWDEAVIQNAYKRKT